jgi:hypothetical protein
LGFTSVTVSVAGFDPVRPRFCLALSSGKGGWCDRDTQLTEGGYKLHQPNSQFDNPLPPVRTRSSASTCNPETTNLYHRFTTPVDRVATRCVFGAGRTYGEVRRRRVIGLRNDRTQLRVGGNRLAYDDYIQHIRHDIACKTTVTRSGGDVAHHFADALVAHASGPDVDPNIVVASKACSSLDVVSARVMPPSGS